MFRKLSAIASISVVRFLAICLIAWAPLGQAALERWEQLGPFEGYVRGTMPLKINPASAGVDTLYAWTFGGGIVKATWNNAGGGGSWNGFVRDSAGLPHGRVYSVTRDGGALVPGTTVMYAAVEGKGVWQATIPANNATALSWNQLTTTNLACHFVFSVFSPAAGHLVAGTTCSGASSGVFHYNAGAWNRVGGVPPAAGSIGSTSGIQIYSFMPVVGITCTNCVYAATSAGVYFTNDYMSGTATWTPLSIQPTGADSQPNVFSIRTHTQGTTLYMAAAVNGGGVQRTSLPNTGTSDFTTVNAWTSAPIGNFGLPAPTVAAGLGGDLGNPSGEYWVGIQGSGLYYSSNGVNTGPLQFSFETGTEGLPQPRFAARATPDPISGASDMTAMIIAATVEGVFYKWPGSPRWNQIWFDDVADAPISGIINGIAIDPKNPSVSYVATSGRFHHLLDRNGSSGASVEITGIGDLGTGGKRRLVLDRTDTGDGGDHSSLWLGGIGTIRKVGCDSFGCFDNGFRVGPNYPGGVNSLPNLRGVAVGVILDTNSAGPGQPVYVFTDRRFPGESVGRGVWKSVDGGNTWSDFSATLQTLGGVAAKHILSAAIATDGTLIVATRAGLFKTSTASASWSAVSTPLPADANYGSIPADVLADGTNVYVAYFTQNSSGTAGPSTGLYTGTTSVCCTKNGSFPSGIKPNVIAVTHPGGNPTPEIWVGATDDVTGGIYKSTDGGTTWRTSNVKLNNKEVRNFGVVQTPAGQPVAIAGVGTTGGGISVRSVQNGPDFNNDGSADIEWRKTNGSNAIWLMNGLQLQTANLINNSATSWTLVGRGDFDGDGQADLLWRNTSTGANAMWLMNGTSLKSAATLSTVGTVWSVAGIGDFDGNGKSDILWRSTSGNDTIWFMNGTATSSIVNTNTVSTSYSVVGIGDFNNDGKSDIFWRNPSTGANIVWLMNGASLVASVPTSTVAAAGWQVKGLGDFDGDGAADVLWHNTSTFDNTIWLMNGGTIKSSSAISKVADANWAIVGIADFNGDYMSDILWRNQTGGGANYIWTMNRFAIQSACGAMGCQSGYLPAVPDSTWSVSNP